MEWGRCGCAMSECMLAEAERKGDQIEKEKHTLLGSFEYRVYERDDFLGTGGGRVFPPSAGACLADGAIGRDGDEKVWIFGHWGVEDRWVELPRTACSAWSSGGRGQKT